MGRHRLLPGLGLFAAAAFSLLTSSAPSLAAGPLETIKSIGFGEFDTRPRQPERVTAIWTHTVLNQEGRVGVRGFGGRLMFYGVDRDRPIKVDGTLTVYAYNDTGREPTECVPDRKFVFKRAQFAGHYSKSQLGHSYSFWVPWDEVGGLQQKITLVCRFEGKGGGIVVSDLASQILPGRLNQDLNPDPLRKPGSTAKAPGPAAPAATPAAAPSGVQQVSYNEPVANNDPNVRRMSTQTISVPGRFLGWQDGGSSGVVQAAAWEPRNPSNVEPAQVAEDDGFVQLPDGEISPELMAQTALQQAAAARQTAGARPAGYVQPVAGWNQTNQEQPLARAQPVAQPGVAPAVIYGGLETRSGAESAQPAVEDQPQRLEGHTPRGVGGPSLFLQQRRGHFGPHQYPARGSPGQPPGSARALMRPRPAGWPSDQPQSPPAELSPATDPRANSPGAAPSSGQSNPSPGYSQSSY